MDTSTVLLLQVYQELFKRKVVLPNAPEMTIPEPEQVMDTFDKEKARQEATAVVAYLLGQKDTSQVNWENWDHLFQIVKKYYDNQPEWKKILLDYLKYLLAFESEENIKIQQNLTHEIEMLTNSEKG